VSHPRILVRAFVWLSLAAGGLLGTALVWASPQPSSTARIVVPPLTALAAVAVTRVLGATVAALRVSGEPRARAVRTASRALPWAAGLLVASVVAYVLLVPADGPLAALMPPLVVAAGAGSALVARPALADGRLHRALVALVVGTVLPLVVGAAVLAPGPGLVLLTCGPLLLVAQAWVTRRRLLLTAGRVPG